jgi:hypothetical protein
MLFGKKSDIEIAEAEIGNLAKRDAKLRRRLADAEVEHERTQAARRDLLMADDDDDGAGDDRAIARAGAAVRDAADGVAALHDAIGEIERQRVAAEARLEAAHEAARRAEAAKVMAASNAEIALCLADFERSSAELLQALEPLSRGGQAIAVGYRAFFEGALGDLTRLLDDLRQSQAAVADGSAPVPAIAIAAPAPDATIMEAAPVPRARCYSLAPIRWSEADGPKSAMRHAVVDLPIQVAQRGVAAGVLLTLDDPRTANLRQVHGVIAWGATSMLLDDAHDLDADRPGALVPIAEAVA